MPTISTTPSFTVIDLYCGSGAVTHGLKRAGFHVVGAIDLDMMACSTYRSNHPEARLLQGDIREVCPTVFESKLPQGLDLLVVCAPCQPFSSQNKKRSSKDERADLVLQSVRFAECLKPKLILFENVPGLEREGVFDTLHKKLDGIGYRLGKPEQVDAAQFGVPQRRQRMILVAAGKSLFKEPVSGSDGPWISKTVRDAIADLPVPSIGRTDNESDPLHFARRHSLLNLERLRYVPKNGGSRASIPLHLQLECQRGKSKNTFPDTYGRMSWDDVAPTLTTGCTDITKGRYVHPEQDRAITLREAARLQSFPDDYIFKGNSGQIATQIGNAVPPGMVTAIGRNLHRVLRSRS